MTELAMPAAPARLSVALDPFAADRLLVEIPSGISPAEALSRNWPERWPHEIALCLIRDGVASEDWTSATRPGESVMICPRTSVPVVLVAGILGVSATSFVAVAATLILNVAISYGLSKLLAPGAVRPPNQDTTRAYQFTGPTTDYRTGGVIPATFGRFPVGGTVLSYVVRNRGLRSELWVLLGLGEGPVAGIGFESRELDDAHGEGLPVGIWINDQEIGTYGGVAVRIGSKMKRITSHGHGWNASAAVSVVGSRSSDISSRLVRVPMFAKDGPRVWTRLGTTTQRPIPGFNSRERVYVVGQDVGPKTWQTDRASVTYKTKAIVDAFEIGIGCPKGLYQSEIDGDLKPRAVAMKYRYRNAAGTDADFSAWVPFTVRATTPDGFVKYEYVEPGTAARYVIEIDRVTAKAGGNDPDDTTFEAVNEIEFRDFSYPGQALCAIKIYATEGLSGSQLRARVLLDGLLCGIWDGNSELNPVFTYQWTRNPFWVALECLRNTEWGMGGYLRFVRYTLSEWLSAAAWADELVAEGLATTVQVAVSSGTDTVKVADTEGWTEDDVVVIDAGEATEEQLTVHEVLSGAIRFKTALTESHAKGAAVERYHERFRFDGSFDTGGSPWESVQSILNTCRARISKTGNRIQLIVARQRPVVGLITDGNGSAVSVTYRDWRHQPNHLVAEYLDESDLWAPATLATNADGAVLDEASSATYYDREEFRPKTIQTFGMTRTAQVRRETAWQLAVLRQARKSAKVTMGLSGIVARLGEVLDVAHPTLASVSVSGRTASAITSGGSTITIDRPVVLAGGTTYAVEVAYKTDQGATNTALRQITSAAGSYARGATLTISGTWPASADAKIPYALGVQGQTVEPFEVVSYALDPETLRLTLELEQYVEALNDAA